jgi:predicted dehydrogenase
MTRREIVIAMNGVTGRMGYRQHLVRSILAIRDAGGLPLSDGSVLVPVPLLVGRNADKLAAIAKDHGVERYTTSLTEALADDTVEIYFDAQTTAAREAALSQAISAGKHIYTEKPTSESLDGAIHLARDASAHGICNGVVQDKLFLPGLQKLRRLVDSGFFGRVLSVDVDFGYWVFEGDWQPAQRPSWNYRAEDGGGIVADMFPHWRYVLDQIIAPVQSVYTTAVTAIPDRYDEAGRHYAATADDAAYGVLGLEGGVIATVRSSWATRVHRDELVKFHVDGTHGSAVAGLFSCKIQPREATPKPVWNPDLPTDLDFRAGWQEVPDNTVFGNGFRIQWEQFLRHVVEGGPFPWDLLEGAKGVQLAELALRSSREGVRLDVPDLGVPA